MTTRPPATNSTTANAGGFRRRREAEDPNNTWNMQLFTALLTKNFTEATNLLEKGANVNHQTANTISTSSAVDAASTGTGGDVIKNAGVSTIGGGALPSTNSNNANFNNQDKDNKQNQQSLLAHQHQQKLINAFVRSGGSVPLCVALVFRASGVANFGEASPGGSAVSPATIPIQDAVESLTWLFEHGCNLNAVVEPLAAISAAQQQQLQQQGNIPASNTALQRPVCGTMFHMCVHFDWSETLEKLLRLRISLLKKNYSSGSELNVNPDFILSPAVCDPHNSTSPTILAIQTNKLDLAKLLIRHLAPFDFFQKADQDHTLLARACLTNEVVLAELLLSLGDDPDQLDLESGRTLLQLAWSSFDRQQFDPALQLPSNLVGRSNIVTAAQTGYNLASVSPAQQLTNALQLQQQQQFLANTTGQHGAAAAGGGKGSKEDPNAGLQMQLLPVLLNRGYDINSQNAEGKRLMTFCVDALPRHLALSHLDSFVQNGGNIDAADAFTGRTLLMTSVDTCDIELMRKLVTDYKADVNAQDAFGATALHRACAGGRRIGLVEQLLAYEQIKINQPDFDGQTPLHRAALRGREAVVKLLISKDTCDVNAVDHDGNTALHLAVREGHYCIVDLLVSLNTNPRPVSADKKGRGAANAAAAASSKKKDNLGEPNPNRLSIDATNNANLTALEVSVSQLSISDQLPIVGKLLSGNASVHRVAEVSQLSLLQQAVIARSLTLVQSFLSRQADVHHRCAKDKTALHYATENQDVAIVEELLASGAVVNAQDSFRLTAPLHIACANLHVELAKIFIERLSPHEVNITNHNFQTPLHIVCDCAGGDNQTATKSNILPDSKTTTLARATAIGKALLAKGARGNSRDFWKRTPLHYAAAADATDLFRELLVCLSNQVWSVDENQSTPLHIACSNKAVNVVEFICRLIETRHQQGIAKTKTSKEIVFALESAIAAGKEKVAAGSSRAVRAGADNARPSDPLVQMNSKKMNLEHGMEVGAASAAACNIQEAEDVSNELEGWRDGLRLKDALGRTPMLLAAQAGSTEIGKMLSVTQKVLMKK